jgi:hypothetical protein
VQALATVQPPQDSLKSTGLKAARAVCRDRGISDVTLWRWCRKGWIKTINIAGRVYVDLASLVEFDRRASLGEFSRPPSGAARRSAELRKAKELTNT